MNRQLKIIALGVVLLTMLLFSSACTSDPYEKTANAFFAAFEKKDYTKMYDLLTPTSDVLVSKEDFTNYYNKVYDMLKIQTIKVTKDDKVSTDDRSVFTYTAQMHSEEYGDFSYQMQLEVLRKTKFYLVEWSPANVVPQMRWNDGIYKSTVKGKRGEIFDTQGRPIVRNGYAITVYAETEKVKDFVTSAASAVSKILNTDVTDTAEKMQKAVKGNLDTAVLAELLPGELTQVQEDALIKLSGIKVDRSRITPIRYYPYKDAAAQTLGYSTPITPDDRKIEAYANLPEGTRIGRSGVEKAYDSLLQGTDGYEIYLRSDTAAQKDVLYTSPAVNGKDISLTLDIVLQASTQKEMKALYGTKCSGTVVVLNPDTGAVETLASYPFYDANLYAFNASRPGVADLYKEGSGEPTLNRTIQGRYPPGSIFKSVMAAEGLQTNVVTPNTVFPYTKEIQYLDNEKDKWRPAGSNWSNYIIRQAFRNVDEARKGVLDMNRGLIWSDNIYFGWLAMKVGKDNYIKYAQDFGIGEAIPFDLPVLPSNLANNMDSFKNQKFLADSGFGQAELLFTPLQLASLFSQFNNNGDIMQPYLLQSINSTDDMGRLVADQTIQPKIYKKAIISLDNILKVRNILEKTATDGTGKSGIAGITNMRVAAKTGTAQTGNGKTEIGWYGAHVIEGGRKTTVLVNVDGPVGGDTAIKFKMVNHVLKDLQDKPAVQQ